MNRAGRVVVWFAGLLCASTLSAQLRIVGSDLLGADFSTALYAAAAKDSLPIAVAFDGSRPGLERLKAGRADLAVLVFPDAAAKPPAEFAGFVVAYHRVVVLAPAALPLEQISLDELARVFDGSVTGRAMRWQELGVRSDAGLANVQPLVPEPALGLTTEFFRQRVLQGRAAAGERYSAPEALERRFALESRVIALAAVPPKTSGVRVLAVSPRAGEPAFLPAAENLQSGDYPLRLPVHVVYPRDAATKVAPVLRYLLSDEAAPEWERVGVVPLPASVRAQQRSALEKR